MMENLTDQDFLRGLSTLLVFIGFIWICIWAYLPSRKKEMQDAANLPFSDDAAHEITDTEKTGTDKKTEVGNE